METPSISTLEYLKKKTLAVPFPSENYDLQHICLEASAT